MGEGAATSGSEGDAVCENPLVEARKAKNMSRAEVVDAANEFIRASDGLNSAEVMTVGVLGKLERGDHNAPRGTLRRQALRHVLGVETDAELGWPALRSAAKNPGAGRVAAGIGDHPGAAGESVDLDSIVDEVTSGVARAASITEARTVSPTTLRELRARLVKLSGDFVHCPPEEVGPKLRRLWKDVSVHLDHGLRQHQGREVYLVAGMICVVLAHLCHVRGQPHHGLVHAEAAELWAQDAGHPELLGWTLGTKALLTGSTEGPMAALQLVEQAQDVLRRSSRPGSGAVRLACYEARFSAEAGLRDRGLAAIRASEDAAEALGGSGAADLDIIGGILSLGEPKRASLCAGPYLSFDCAELAEQHAHAAIAGYLTGPAEQCSYGDVALSQLTVARARVSAGNLDGVLEAVQPVLKLPQPQRIAPVSEQLSRLASALSTPRFLGAAAAKEIRDEIKAFQQPPQATLPM